MLEATSYIPENLASWYLELQPRLFHFCRTSALYTTRRLTVRRWNSGSEWKAVTQESVSVPLKRTLDNNSTLESVILKLARRSWLTFCANILNHVFFIDSFLGYILNYRLPKYAKMKWFANNFAFWNSLSWNRNDLLNVVLMIRAFRTEKDE